MRLRGGPAQSAGGVWLVQDAGEVTRLLGVLAGESWPVGLDLEFTYVEKRHNLEHSRATCMTLGLRGLRPQYSGVPWSPPLEVLPGVPMHQRVFIPAFENDDLIQQMKPWLENASKPKVGHNIISADAHVLRNHGIVLRGVVSDTLRKSRLVYNSKDVKHGLKPVMARELGYEVTDLSSIDTRPKRLKPAVQGGKRGRDAVRKAPKSSPLAGLPTLYIAGEVGKFSWTERETIPHAELWRDYPGRRAAFVDYATLDAKATAELDYPLSKRLARLPAPGGTNNLDLYNTVWQPYCELVAGMEVTGIALDVEQCNTSAAVAAADVAAYDAQLEVVTPGVNWGSPKQLAEILFRTWSLPRPPIKNTVKAIKPSKPDEWSTSEASLHWLELNCEEYRETLGIVRRRRKAARLHGYLRDLPGFVHSDGRLHTVLAPSTDTGRLASSSPPLQQIPNAKSDRYGIRRAFVAGPGRCLIVADYSQLEVYVLAHFLLHVGEREKWEGRDAIATALATGDVYSEIAKLCWPQVTTPAKTTKVPGGGGMTYRDLAKIVVLARNYGKTEQGLAISLLDETGTSVGIDFARGILAAYDAGFPALQAWTKYIGDFARQHGGVATILGRWRPIPECRSDREYERSAGDRKAANTPIQGSAADVVACAGLGLARHPRLVELGWVQCLHVHDEVISNGPAETADEALSIITQVMENPPGISLRVPLKVEAKIAPDWASGK